MYQRHPTPSDEYEDNQTAVGRLKWTVANTTDPARRADAYGMLLRFYGDLFRVCPRADRPYWRRDLQAFKAAHPQAGGAR